MNRSIGSAYSAALMAFGGWTMLQENDFLRLYIAVKRISKKFGLRGIPANVRQRYFLFSQS